MKTKHSIAGLLAVLKNGDLTVPRNPDAAVILAEHIRAAEESLTMAREALQEAEAEVAAINGSLHGGLDTSGRLGRIRRALAVLARAEAR